MIEFGKTLRAAREAKGYTIAQLCDITHMAPTTIENLEDEDFSRIPAPIYGRGFVKLYCTAVGLEVQPMVNEFMDIFLGNREATIREIPDDPEPESNTVEAPPATEPPPIIEPQPVEDPQPMAEPQPAFKPQPIQTTFDSTPQKMPEPPVVQSENEPVISRYSTPLRTAHDHLTISPSIWRMCLLAVIALGLVILLGFGIRALYRATDPRAETPDESQLPPAPTVVETPATDVPSAPRAPRAPIAVPPLYVD